MRGRIALSTLDSPEGDNQFPYYQQPYTNGALGGRGGPSSDDAALLHGLTSLPLLLRPPWIYVLLAFIIWFHVCCGLSGPGCTACCTRMLGDGHGRGGGGVGGSERPNPKLMAQLLQQREQGVVGGRTDARAGGGAGSTVQGEGLATLLGFTPYMRQAERDGSLLSWAAPAPMLASEEPVEEPRARLGAHVLGRNARHKWSND